MSTVYGFAEWEDAESWDKIEGDIREEAAANAFAQIDNEQCRTVYICERGTVEKDRAFHLVLDADDVLERAEEYASENGIGSWLEDNIFDHSHDAKLALENALRAAVVEWLKSHPGPAVWESINVTAHTR